MIIYYHRIWWSNEQNIYLNKFVGFASIKWPVGNWCPKNDPSPYHTMFFPYRPLKQAAYTKFANQRCGIHSGVGLEPVGKWWYNFACFCLWDKQRWRIYSGVGLESFGKWCPITAAEAYNGLLGLFLLMKRALCVFVCFVIVKNNFINAQQEIESNEVNWGSNISASTFHYSLPQTHSRSHPFSPVLIHHHHQCMTILES